MEFTFPEIISLKQRGERLTKEQIEWLIDEIIHKRAHDAQVGAFLMAVFYKGMELEETAALTSTMTRSGDVLRWPDEWKHLVADKHSTGGVGDKVSLVLAPALASCGLKVPMISGRSLGFTGGTLDKLESIPGYNVDQSLEKMRDIVTDVGCCIVGQTKTLVPADKILYGLRDITSTVASTPLICASIISKKAAEGLSNLVLDVKYGRGSWQRSAEDATEMAKVLVGVANGVGVRTTALITSMEEPLGNMIGNALEVIESVDCLNGKGPADVMELVTKQGGQLLFQSALAATAEEGEAKISESISSRAAIGVFKRMLIAQGVDAQIAEKTCQDPYSTLRVAANCTEFKSPRSGVITAIDALTCAHVSSLLGAGRQQPSDDVTHDTGIQLLRKVGMRVLEGEVWARVYHVQEKMPDELRKRMENVVTVEDVEEFSIKSKVHNLVTG